MQINIILIINKFNCLICAIQIFITQRRATIPNFQGDLFQDQPRLFEELCDFKLYLIRYDSAGKLVKAISIGGEFLLLR